MNNLTESFNHHSAGMKRKRLVPSVCHTMHLTDSSHQYPKKIKSPKYRQAALLYYWCLLSPLK